MVMKGTSKTTGGMLRIFNYFGSLLKSNSEIYFICKEYPVIDPCEFLREKGMKLSLTGKNLMQNTHLFIIHNIAIEFQKFIMKLIFYNNMWTIHIKYSDIL